MDSAVQLDMLLPPFATTNHKMRREESFTMIVHNIVWTQLRKPTAAEFYDIQHENSILQNSTCGSGQAGISSVICMKVTFQFGSTQRHFMKDLGRFRTGHKV